MRYGLVPTSDFILSQYFYTVHTHEHTHDTLYKSIIFNSCNVAYPLRGSISIYDVYNAIIDCEEVGLKLNTF